VEHVTDVNQFVQDCASAVRPGGVLVMSTLNRTALSCVLSPPPPSFSRRLCPHCALHGFGLLLLCPRALLCALLTVTLLTLHCHRYGLGIVMAEGVLGLAPIGTHTYSKFVTPDELRQALQDVGLHVDDVRGMQYSPLSKRWSLTDSTSMNYIISAIKPPGERST
jgi:2-polyprenyl-6-hydroxyphenyl methylase/3-demethylubiquinone-9 3-methyltransferase